MPNEHAELEHEEARSGSENDRLRGTTEALSLRTKSDQ